MHWARPVKTVLDSAGENCPVQWLVYTTVRSTLKTEYNSLTQNTRRGRRKRETKNKNATATPKSPTGLAIPGRLHVLQLLLPIKTTTAVAIHKNHLKKFSILWIFNLKN